MVGLRLAGKIEVTVEECAEARTINRTDCPPAGKMAEAELLQWVLTYALLGWLPGLQTWIRAHGREHYLTASTAFETCDLDSLYSVHHDAERMCIAKQDGFASAAELGFRALGLRILQSQKERDRIMELRTRLTFRDILSCYMWWRRAHHYGWEPESWKWAWIFMWYGGTWKHRRLHRALWHDWVRSFWKTEYSWIYRIQILGRYFIGGLIATVRNSRSI